MKIGHPESDVKRKAKEKFGTLIGNQDLVVPDSLVVQQASSYATAIFAASLIPEHAVVADLTAGLGVNTVCFSIVSKFVYAVERDPERARALKANLELLDIRNVSVDCIDCNEWLENFSASLDVVFVDPSRRSGEGKKLIRLSDCSPDLEEILPSLKEKTSRVIVKCSPLLDLTAAVREFPYIKTIYIIEYKRDVREILLDINLDYKEREDTGTDVSCVVLNDNTTESVRNFSLTDRDLNNDIPFLQGKNDVQPESFIYEPSPSYMKAGFWGSLIKEFPSLKKFGVNTHLFYSKKMYSNFPGRAFKINGFYSSKDLKKMRGMNFNVISRNHPASANEIASRFKLTSSETEYLIACTAGKDKLILRASKIS